MAYYFQRVLLELIKTPSEAEEGFRSQALGVEGLRTAHSRSGANEANSCLHSSSEQNNQMKILHNKVGNGPPCWRGEGEKKIQARGQCQAIIGARKGSVPGHHSGNKLVPAHHRGKWSVPGH